MGLGTDVGGRAKAMVAGKPFFSEAGDAKLFSVYKKNKRKFKS